MNAFLRLFFSVAFLIGGQPSYANVLTGGTFELDGGANHGGVDLTGTGGFTGEGSEFGSCGAAGERTGGTIVMQCGNAGFSLLSYLQVNTVAAPGNVVQVQIPANATSTDFDLFVNVDPLNNPQRVDSNIIAIANAKLLNSHGTSFAAVSGGIAEINILQENQQFFDGVLNSPSQIQFQYSDADNDGIVDGSNPPIRTKTLRIWTLDETRMLWVRVPGAIRNSTLRTVTALVNHFSVYALIGGSDTEVNSMIAFPVPWSPNSGDPSRGTKADGICFSNVPSEGAIRIYNLAGELVRTLNIDTGSPNCGSVGTLKWNVKTEGGSDVVSGVYIWIVKSGSNTKSGKLMVIR